MCIFSEGRKEGNELLVCLNINYKHQVLLQKMIVAHLLGEFIAFCTFNFFSLRHGTLSWKCSIHTLIHTVIT